MPARRLTVPLALALAPVLIAGSACSSDSKATDKSAPPKTTGGNPSPSKVQVLGQLTKEGWFGAAPGLHARLEIKGVERQGAKTVLKYAMTSLDPAPKSLALSIPLLDPVGRKLYKPITAPPAGSFQPNTAQDQTAEYPAIPQGVEKVTAITPGTAGEFTGVPVTGTGDSPASGTESADQSNGNPLDLYDITEGEIKDVTSSGSDVKMNLRTDVLFDFNSAKLSGRAKSVLDEAAQEIKAKADPAKRPLTIDGHTDSKGSDQYNLKLSRERAEAVTKQLQARLGKQFKYSPHGKGETELIAKEGGPDDAKARARNRRVEISYVVRQQAPGVTSASTSAAGGRGGTVKPADFRGEDGQKVASRYARVGQQKRRLDVKPFYRDGAYIVAVFDIVDEGPGPIPPQDAYPHKDYAGGAFTSFSIVGPNGKDVYRAVRVGQPAANGSASYVDPGAATFRTGENEPNRGFVYIPAPPGDATTVTFDGGPFGKVNNVPVQ
jgi:outer membrane protein OmpA-like peptidoglycan-associated protein